MWGFRGDWFVVVGLYVVGLGAFHLLGGLDSAAEAFRRWGGREAARRRHRLPPRL
jgi:hypothetical protein